MVINKWTALGALVLAAGLAWYFFIYDSPEKKIKKQFDYLAEKLEKQAGESPIITAGKSKAAGDVFSEVFTIDIPEYGTQKKITSKELTQHILAYKSRVTALSVKFYDLSVELEGDNKATATVTAGVRATTSSGERQEDIQEFECRLEKFDDDWKFYQVEAVEVLEK